MNSYFGLVLRYLKNNKQRTVFTMLGIIITVFLVFSVLTFGYSCWDYNLYRLNRDNGDYELEGEANPAQIEQLGQHVNVKNVCAEENGTLSYNIIKDMVANTAESPYISEIAYLEPENNCMGYQVSEGRMPENGQEFVIDTGAKGIYADLQIGETYDFLFWDSDEFQNKIKKEEYEKYGIFALEDGSVLKYGTYARRMKLVGFFEKEDDFGFRDILLLTKKETSDGNYDIHISLYDKDNLAKSAEELSEKYGISCKPDVLVEMYMGQGDSLESALIKSIVAIIAALFAFFSIYIVRNTMMIAVVERIQDYGILRCIGTSGKQLFYMLFLEGIIMGGISVIPGMALSYGMLRLLSDNLLNSSDMLPGFQVGIYPQAVLFTVLITLFAILYSLIEPGRQAVSISPVEALRRDVVLRDAKGKAKEKIKKRKMSIWGVLFGIEGDYAYKNVMRSRGKFLSMVVGFSLCIFLFVIVSAVMDSAQETMDRSMRGEEEEYAVIVKIPGAYEADKTEGVIDEISKLSGVDTVGKRLRKEYVDINDEHMKIKNAKDTYISQLGYDREHMEELKKYVLEGEIDYDALQNNGIVLFDTMTVKDENGMSVDKRKTELHAGDTVSFLSLEEEMKTSSLFWKEWDIYHSEDATDSDITYEEHEIQSKARLIEEAKKNGYDTGNWKKPEEYEGLDEVFEEIKQIAFDRGNVETYTIQAIVSNDYFNSSNQWHADSQWYQIMMTEECYENKVIGDEKKFRSLYPEIYTIKNLYGEFIWSIGLNIKKGADLTEVVKYFEQHPEYQYEDNGANTLLQELRVYRMVAFGIIICIVVITALQMCNTIYSNMLLRKKEFFLYSVVGMSRRRISKMVMLEGFFAAIISAVIGNVGAVALSRYLIDGLLNQDGTIIYRVPIGSCLFATAFVVLLTLGITAFCKKNEVY